MATKNLPPLLVDENLLGLTRWLRFLGFDARMAKGWPDREVADFARRKQRVLITRDAALAAGMRAHPVVRVLSDDPRAQLVAVLRTLRVPETSLWFTRCVRCNQPLRKLSSAEAAESETLPSFWKAHPEEEFWRCEHREKVYWRGSHFTRTRAYLEEVRAQVES